MLKHSNAAISDRKIVRYLEGYTLGRSEGETSRRILHWEVVPEAVFWDTGDLAGEGNGKGIFFLSNDGLWSLTGKGDDKVALKRVIQTSPFLATGEEDLLPILDFMRDWNGDGKEEILIPMASEALFYQPTSDGRMELIEKVPVRQASVYNNNVLFGRKVGSYNFLSVFLYPLIVPTDLNGDKRQDLLVIQGGKGFRNLRTREGRLEEAAVPWDLDIRTPEEVIRRRASLAYHVVDLNHDGCADVVVHKVGAQFQDWSSETAIFLGHPQGPDAKGPVLRLPSRGFLSGVSLEDLDGDGYHDMALWSVRMGLWPLVQILLRRVINLESDYHYYAGEKLFLKKPEYKRGYEFRIDTSRPDYFAGLVPNTEGDFNGDGVGDLVAQNGEGQLGIYVGRPRQGFEQSASASFPAPSVNYVKIVDLDADGRDDIYAYQAEKGESFLYIWLNRQGEGY